MKRIVIWCSLLLALATAATASALAADQPWEVTIGEYMGLKLDSVGAGIKAPISDHWQLKLRYNRLLNGYDNHHIQLGINYNFSDDWNSSFYLGAGAQFDYASYRWAGGKFNFSGTRPYIELGKRISLSRDIGLTWSPEVQLSYDKNYTELRVTPLNLSILF